MSLKLYRTIREIRKLKGFTQTDVAKRIGINQKAYSKMELGKTQLNWEKLNTIAEILSVNVFELIDPTRSIDEINLDGTFQDETINLTKELFKNFENQITELEKENQSLKQEVLILKSRC